MLTLLIPGPKASDKDIDVFLRPLVDELKELWADGINTCDTGTNNRSVFRMRAVLLWIVNDFPVRSSLSGWSGQRYMACPTCNEKTPLVYVIEEVIIGGPVHMRWMYPFKRYLKKLKDSVRNRARPEGSIDERYVVDEALTFCSRYMQYAKATAIKFLKSFFHWPVDVSSSLCVMGDGMVTENYVTSNDISTKALKDDQFILASQVQQVFYIEDPSRGDTLFINNDDVEDDTHEEYEDDEISSESNEDDSDADEDQSYHNSESD
ncbi:DUF4218 domain-containing protein [Abeliophyllum distichum]|uniref:DUF4218 domain-containing protein n=1 Tax=Abeliophyllum distichum TaxID=126358 RepID=A0ABD1RE62_9LAMI